MYLKNTHFTSFQHCQFQWLKTFSISYANSNHKSCKCSCKYHFPYHKTNKLSSQVNSNHLHFLSYTIEVKQVNSNHNKLFNYPFLVYSHYKVISCMLVKAKCYNTPSEYTFNGKDLISILSWVYQ